MNRREFLQGLGVAIGALFIPRRPIAIVGATDGRTYAVRDGTSLDELVAIDARYDGSLMIAASKDCVIVSEDCGRSWRIVNSPPTKANITCACIVLLRSWYVGTDNGELWATNDFGKTWFEQEYTITDDAIRWTEEICT